MFPDVANMIKRRHWSQRSKWKLGRMQFFKCSICREMLDENAQIDHVLPLGDGGKDDFSNLQLLHTNCHSLKTALENSARARRTRALFCEVCSCHFSRHFISAHDH